MIDEKKLEAFQKSCRDLSEDKHIVLAVVLEKDFKGRDFQFAQAIKGSYEGLYCALQLLTDCLYSILANYDGEHTDVLMKCAHDIGIKKAKERATSAASLAALN